ncbi:tripartite tricarboxylate transporter substrate binding protein [Methylobacterium durans]|uniref:Bug family tripartite tricarboxylate transporter substrate binding protein n=1 Tax=Methylobacterium durans TaxID=2202825 RepID=UPI002AFF9AF0|nr:tripartite tricarboxylate transporter substrate binding protein [Methylobacterium durans]MEA1834910.1 tripartite tricarboxylate transporter substrate binding protein [Methylobacterium durans]
MPLVRRAVLLYAVATFGLPWMASLALAQSYPSHPVRIVVGFPAGGPVDLAARVIGPWLSERLGQPFVIENRPGESGNIATREVLRAAPDGHTLLLCGPVNTINTTLFTGLDFDFANDVAPVAGISRVPLVIEVHPSLRVRSVPEFLALARERPGGVRVAYAGKGTPQHLGIELFKAMAGVDLTLVPYLGSAPALADLLDGRVDAMFDPLPSSIEHIRAGRLIPLAVTARERSQALPDVPSIDAFVPGYEAGSWFGLVAPKGTPITIVESLDGAVAAGLADPTVRGRLAGMGATPMPLSSDGFGRFIVGETERYGAAVRAAGLRSQ